MIKNLLWNLIKGFFSNEIKSHVDSFKQIHYQKIKTEKDREQVLFNYPKGKKVILRSNEPDELIIGEVIRYEDFGKDKLFLIIKDQATGKEVVSPNNDPPYWSKEREEALKKINWAEQWNVMSKYYDIDCEHQAYKEDPAYLNRTK